MEDMFLTRIKKLRELDIDKAYVESLIEHAEKIIQEFETLKEVVDENRKLKDFIGLYTAFDVTDKAMNAARYDGYLDGIQVGMKQNITKELDMDDMPKEIYSRALRAGKRKTLSAVRPESPLIAEKEGTRMQYTKYIKADLVDVDVESLRKPEPEWNDGFIDCCKAKGWNDCLDYLLEQGYLRAKNK